MYMSICHVPLQSRPFLPVDHQARRPFQPRTARTGQGEGSGPVAETPARQIRLKNTSGGGDNGGEGVFVFSRSCS